MGEIKKETKDRCYDLDDLTCNIPYKYPDGEIIYNLQIKNWKEFFSVVFCMDKDWASSGVYLFDNVYVGESSKIRDRIKRHIIDSLKGRHCNGKLQRHILEKLNRGLVMDVKFMSGNENNERKVFDSLKESGYTLYNIAKTRK